MCAERSFREKKDKKQRAKDKTEDLYCVDEAEPSVAKIFEKGPSFLSRHLLMYNPPSRFNRYLLSFVAISQINCVFTRVYRYTDGVALTRPSYTWEIRMARDY